MDVDEDTNNEKDNDENSKFQIDDFTPMISMFDKLTLLYTTALLEWILPLEECHNPIVMIFKYSHLSTIHLSTIEKKSIII